jgi:hypothetical protein
MAATAHTGDLSVRRIMALRERLTEESRGAKMVASPSPRPPCRSLIIDIQLCNSNYSLDSTSVYYYT